MTHVLKGYKISPVSLWRSSFHGPVDRCMIPIMTTHILHQTFHYRPHTLANTQVFLFQNDQPSYRESPMLMRSGFHYDWETKQHFCSWVQISWPSFAQYCIWTVAVYLYKQQDLNYNIWNYVMPCNRKYTSFFLTVAFAHWWQSYTPLTVCAIAAFHAFFDCSLTKFLKISKLSDYIFTE